MLDYRQKTKGCKIDLSDNDTEQVLVAGEASTMWTIDPGTEGRTALTMGELVTASKHRFHALLELSMENSGKLMGFFILSPDGSVVEGNNEELLVATVPGLVMYPLHYKYYDLEVRVEDTHVDQQTGWDK